MRAMIVDESLQGRQGGSFNHYPGLAPRARWTAGVGAGGRARLRGSGKRSARTKQKDWTVEEDRWRRTNQRGRRRAGRRDNERHRRPPLSPRAPHQPRPARGQFVGGRNCPATAANRSRRRDPWGQMNLVFQSPSVGAQLWPTTTERSGRTVRRGLALIEFVLRACGFSPQRPQPRAKERDDRRGREWIQQDWPRVKNPRAPRRPPDLPRGDRVPDAAGAPAHVGAVRRHAHAVRAHPLA